MKFWVDQNLPPALARWLTLRGHDAAHVLELGLDCASDQSILAGAIAAGAAILTKDEDFAFSGLPPKVIVRIGNVTNARLLAAVALHWGTIENALLSGETLVEFRE
jgi:predicted nuclease of predicted toxin-antitoxin system